MVKRISSLYKLLGIAERRKKYIAPLGSLGRLNLEFHLSSRKDKTTNIPSSLQNLLLFRALSRSWITYKNFIVNIIETCYDNKIRIFYFRNYIRSVGDTADLWSLYHVNFLSYLYFNN